LARERWKGRRDGEARRGEALGSGVGSTGLRLVCGHRLGTLRRDVFNGGSELQTKPNDDDVARFATPTSRFAARTSERGVKARRRQRFFAENFIGRIVRRSSCIRGDARRRFGCASWATRHLSLVRRKSAGNARAGSCVRAYGFGIGCDVALDQPSCLQGITAFVHPYLEKLRDFLSYVGSEIQTRLLVGLQSRFRRTQQKFPIHFLSRLLAHGDPPNGVSTLPFY
jgi:hypothetical protein